MELTKENCYLIVAPTVPVKQPFNLLTANCEGTNTQMVSLLNGKAPIKTAAGGLGRTSKNTRLFKDLSVLTMLFDCLCQSPQTTCLCVSLSAAAITRMKKLERKALELLGPFLVWKKQIPWPKTWATGFWDQNSSSLQSDFLMNLLQGWTSRNSRLDYLICRIEAARKIWNYTRCA